MQMENVKYLNLQLLKKILLIDIAKNLFNNLKNNLLIRI